MKKKKKVMTRVLTKVLLCEKDELSSLYHQAKINVLSVLLKIIAVSFFTS